MPNFTHLHVHTQYSLLDGLCKNEDLATACKEDGQDALAITDHGVMYGAVHFYNTIKKAGIKPIIGMEAYYTPDDRADRSKRQNYHLLLLAKNFQGYQNLLKLTSIANLEGFYYKPRIDWEILSKYHKGLIATSACMQGEIPQLLKDDDLKLAGERLTAYTNLFGEDFYLEIQRHPGIDDVLEPINQKIIELSRKFGVPLVATNDVHYVRKEDARAQDALLAIQTRKTLSDKNRMTMMDSQSYYLKTQKEMTDLFSDFPDAINNTRVITDKCNLKIPTGTMIYPKYPLPDANDTPESHLRTMVKNKINTRYPKVTSEIKKRIKYELDIICNKGYASYFLITQDFINWAKKNGIRIGPGRGSAAGSVVSYILRITSIDPFVHGLQFERFLNPQRPSPPDIDVDIADTGRDRVIQYVTDKYGADKVAQVITFGTMEARAAIRDIGRVLGMPYSEPDQVAKLIPLGNSLDEALKGVAELQEMYKTPKYKELIDLARRVQGVARHASTHAAAVIIADADITNYAPVQRDSKGGNITTQYDMYALDMNVRDDAIGLLKMDFLGLRNLTILQNAVNQVEQSQGIKVDLSNLKLDNKQVFEMLSRGETTGVFQMESTGMRRLAKQLSPDLFSDIVALIALYRPGPMALIPDFIKGKKDPESVKYLHPDLKLILSETYGIVVYQEQVLKIANQMAGYSLGEADILRRAMGKKSAATMHKESKKFITKAVSQGYTESLATEVWSFIEKFAGYGFNKAHAASYAMIAYQTAYMKANYPVEYMAAFMSAETGKEEKLALALEECRNMKIHVLSPDINQSNNDFNLEKDRKSFSGNAIRFGLQAIKNVGSAAIDNILTERVGGGEFKSFTDFVARIDTQKVNKRVLESLIKVGAMDQFGKRAVILDEIDHIRAKVGKNRGVPDNQGGLFDSLMDEMNLVEDKFESTKSEFASRELMEMERTLLGVYLREHPSLKMLKKTRDTWSTKLGELDEKKGQKVTVLGIIKSFRVVFTKAKNLEMAFMTITDETGEADCVIFPSTYQEVKELLIQNNVIKLKCKVEEREEKISLITDSLEGVDAVGADDSPDSKTKNQELVTESQIIIPRSTTKPTLLELNKLLQNNKGDDQVKLIFQNGHSNRELQLPFGINYTLDLKTKIADLINIDPITN